MQRQAPKESPEGTSTPSQALGKGEVDTTRVDAVVLVTS